MELNIITPAAGLRKFHLKQTTELDSFNLFRKGLISYAEEVKLGEHNRETEEYFKKPIVKLLNSAGFTEDYYINTHGYHGNIEADLVIHAEATGKSSVNVILELKKPSNKAEMITVVDFNRKAFHEAILYYLYEKAKHNNNELTQIIITDCYHWFIFDAIEFRKLFFDNSTLNKAFNTWKKGGMDNSSTETMHNVLRQFIAQSTEVISCAYFNIRDIANYALEEATSEKLLPVLKILSPQHLLKLSIANDSNELNKAFYFELLHIIGLEERKEKGKKLIDRKKNTDSGSLLENTMHRVRMEGKLKVIPNLSDYGSTVDEQLFNISLELCITWVNRILFLKLLEGQLKRYHLGDKRFSFLNKEVIPEYDELNILFFDVLAHKAEEREKWISERFSFVPYLNSSLFEPTKLEAYTISIASLRDMTQIDVLSSSVLNKGNDPYPKQTRTLHYFLDFLDSYSFGAESIGEIREKQKTIINASVLGLIFEKINGYKDGSFFTPGFITMYICQESIRKAVVEKFNERFDWKCHDIAEVDDRLDRERIDKLLANELINSMRICDPAVGSGHFLVSALNEIISIKSDLHLLLDNQGKRLTHVQVVIENDELNITNEDGDLFEYYVKANESSGSYKRNVSHDIHRIQETIFREKQIIIENCIFGVDLNPNSVKICRLRLWIELLKNAYYTAESKFMELQTLPNIDINIKRGNSLLSRFKIDDDISEVFRKDKNSLSIYKNAVQSYKETKSKTDKEELSKLITHITDQFRTTLIGQDPLNKKLSKIRGEVTVMENPGLFGAQTNDKLLKQKQVELAKLEKEREEILNNAIYSNAFEWRFEFPEVLNEKGDFVGFDVIIANPPYIQLQGMGKEADSLQRAGYQTFVRSGDIYCLFFELAINLLKGNGILGFITSNKWMRATYGQALRSYIIKNSNPLKLVDFSGIQIFDSATVDTSILFIEKANFRNEARACIIGNDFNSQIKLSDYFRQNSTSASNFSSEQGWAVLSSIESRIKQKIEAAGIPLKNWNVNIYRGLLTGFNKAFIIDGSTRNELISKSPKSAEIIRPILKGRNIKKYKAEFDDLWVIFTRRGIDINKYPAVNEYLLQFYDALKPRAQGDTQGRKPGNYEWFELQDNVSYYKDFDKEKLIWLELTDIPKFAFDSEKYFVEATAFILTGDKLRFLSGFLNSKLCQWYFDKITTSSGMGTNRWKKVYIEHLHVPKTDVETEKNIEKIVTEIIVKINNNQNISDKEEELNRAIFNIFGFTTEEQEFLKRL